MLIFFNSFTWKFIQALKLISWNFFEVKHINLQKYQLLLKEVLHEVNLKIVKGEYIKTFRKNPACICSCQTFIGSHLNLSKLNKALLYFEFIQRINADLLTHDQVSELKFEDFEINASWFFTTFPFMRLMSSTSLHQFWWFIFVWCSFLIFTFYIYFSISDWETLVNENWFYGEILP